MQAAGFVARCAAKGETSAEMAGLVQAMLGRRDPGRPLPTSSPTAVDVVGTGGDRAHTVNISTMAAIVAAAAGVRWSSTATGRPPPACGTADVLEQFGIPFELGPAGVARTVAEAGMGFCFAARFHPGMRHAGRDPARARRTDLFNMLGPLTNPARPRAGAVGCFDPRMAPVMAGVFAAPRRLGAGDARRGRAGRVHHRRADPGLGGPGRHRQGVAGGRGRPGRTPGQPADLRGGDAAFNADVVRRLLAGETGPVRDAVLVNAAAALATQGPLDGDLTEALRAGLDRAAESVDSGAAAGVLDRWIEVARSL